MSIRDQNAETEKAMRGRAAERAKRPDCANCGHAGGFHTLVAAGKPAGWCVKKEFGRCDCHGYEAEVQP